MSKMTVMWVVIYMTTLLGSFVNPIFGTLGYSVRVLPAADTALVGRRAPNLRWNLTIALVLIFTYVIRRGVAARSRTRASRARRYAWSRFSSS